MIIMKRKLFLSLAAGAIVFLSGFGAMYLFRITEEYPSELPGLFSYYSSALGDSILLPIIGAGFVLFFLNSDHKLTAKQKRITAAFGIAGALFGVAQQISWLADPDIILNWTIPKTHYFNAPGWYHAAFLVLMISFCAYSAARWVITVRSKTEHSTSDKLISAVIWGSAAGFLYMYAIDNIDPKAAYAKLYTAPAVLTAFVLLFSILMRVILPQNAKARRGYIIYAALFSAVIISAVCVIAHAAPNLITR